jgi:hypothetical protein
MDECEVAVWKGAVRESERSAEVKAVVGAVYPDEGMRKRELIGADPESDEPGNECGQERRVEVGGATEGVRLPV